MRLKDEEGHHDTEATTLAAVLVLLLCLTPAVFARGDDERPSDEAQRPAQQPKVKEGGKDDLNAIGSREIGGRGVGNWYSLETEIRMGREYTQMTGAETDHD
jgi:hypothetical protein